MPRGPSEALNTPTSTTRSKPGILAHEEASGFQLLAFTGTHQH